MSVFNIPACIYYSEFGLIDCFVFEAVLTIGHTQFLTSDNMLSLSSPFFSYSDCQNIKY